MTNVLIAPQVPAHIHVAPMNAVVEYVQGVKSTPMVLKFYFYCRKNQIPTGKEETTALLSSSWKWLGIDLNAQFLISYTSPAGEARVTVVPFALPLWLSCRYVAPGLPS